MKKQSAGLLLYRIRMNEPEFLLVHPGGPFFKNKENGVWSIPKGELHEDEDHFTAALREAQEELGVEISGDFKPLKPIKQKSGKVVYAWAIEYDQEIENFKSNTFEMEWPPTSGKKQSFPEVDKIEWFTLDHLSIKIIPEQLELIYELMTQVNQNSNSLHTLS